MANDELNELRKAVARLERNANRKMNRLAREKGADVKRSSVNPVRKGRAQKYNTKQLQSYAEKLQTFNSRDVQYVGGTQGNPLDAKNWKRYEKLQAEFQKKANRDLEEYGHLPDPLAPAMTLKQGIESRTPRYPTMRGATNKIEGPTRTPITVPSDAKLKKLIKEYEKKNAQGDKYFQRKNRENRKQAIQMFTAVDPKLAERIRNMDDKQFAIMWNRTEFAKEGSLGYLKSQGVFKVSDEPDTTELELNRIADDSVNRAMEYLEWAEKNLK